MKHAFTFFLITLSVFTASSQRNIWQFDFSTDTVYVRTDTCFVMQKAIVDIPGKGLVILRMDGVVTGSPGDNITMGVSNYNKWSTNFGNCSYYFNDSTTTQQQFHHMMVFDAEPGQQDYFAVMQNWTDKNGTGFAAAKGRMTVEYIPGEAQENNYTYLQFRKYPFVVTDQPTIIDSITITANQDMAYLLSAFFKGSNIRNQVMEVMMKYEDKNGLHTVVIPSPIVNNKNIKQFSFAEFAEFEAGNHTVYFLSRKISGDFNSSNNAFYGTAFATPLINHEGNLPYFSSTFSKEIDKQSQKSNIEEISFEVPENGKLFLMSNGYWSGIVGDKMNIELSWGSGQNENVSTSSFSVDDTEGITHYTTQQVLPVSQGEILPISLKAKYSPNPSGTGITLLSGNISGYLISDISTSSSSSESLPTPSWTIYPNPSTEKLTVEYSSTDSACYDFFIVDNTGELIFQKNVCEESAWILDVETLKAGAYTVIIKTPQQTSSQKLVVLH